MQNIFAFGDSIMKGIVTNTTRIDEGSTKYVISDSCFVNRVELLKNVSIRNLSRFGSTVKGGLSNLDRHLKEISPGDKVVLEFGGNDCNFDWKAIAANPMGQHAPTVDLRQFRELYAQVIERVTSANAVPVLLSLPVLLPRRFFDFVSRGLNKDNILLWLGGDVSTISNWHEQYNIAVFKLANKHGMSVIDISTVFLGRRNLCEYYCLDGMHPNEKGHALIAEAVLHAGLL